MKAEQQFRMHLKVPRARRFQDSPGAVRGRGTRCPKMSRAPKWWLPRLLRKMRVEQQFRMHLKDNDVTWRIKDLKGPTKARSPLMIFRKYGGFEKIDF